MRENTTVPNLVISQKVLDKMASATEHFIEDETGEAMVGFIVPGSFTNGVPTVYVLDTIAPDSSAVRMMHTFQQGDERQDELIWWLQENWRVHREELKKPYKKHDKKWDVPLRYLGDWHKQPGYMIAPSGGDLMTALDWLDDPDNNMEFLLVPIVTLDHPPTTIANGQVNFLTIPQRDGSYMRVDWWYIDSNIRAFTPITPTTYPADNLPSLVGYPWHLIDDVRFNREMKLLQEDGVLSSIVLWEADGKLPLEVCLFTARAGASKILLVVTWHDYPRSFPVARIAPFTRIGPDDDMYEVFEQLWDKSEPVSNPPGWVWSEEKTLLDFIRALEQHLGLPTSTPKPVAAQGGGETTPPVAEKPAEAGEKSAEAAAEAISTSDDDDDEDDDE
ncbi:MAG: hypothetical protein U0694_08820 [Anaerolineae bacterium]